MTKATDLSRPQPRAGIMDIEAYVPGKSAAQGAAKVHKLSSNENPLGSSPKAIEAVREVAGKLEFYPDGAATKLREAIGEAHGLNPANIVCSNGSDEILGLLAQTYLSPGDEAIFTEHGFLVYKIYIQAAGAMPVSVKETEERADVDAILAAVSAKTKIVFLANPNNPTGTYLPFEEIRRLHAGLPKHVLLVLDAAYAEYVRRNDYEAGVELVGNSQNVVMTRTFSKIHGLGGVAHRLDVRAGAHRRRHQPHARAVQRQRRGHRGRRRRTERPRPCRAHRRAQRPLAAPGSRKSCRSSACASRRASAISS